MKKEELGLFYYVEPKLLASERKWRFKTDMNFKDEVRKEYRELTEKIDKLDNFITEVLTGKIKKENVEKFDLLERQLEVMKEYADILEKRLDD